MEDYDTFRVMLGRVVRATRIKGGRSQEGLAYAAGLSPNYFGGIERGERNASIVSLLRVADALAVPLSELIIEAEELARAQEGRQG